MNISIKAFGHQVMSRKYTDMVERASNLRPGFLEVYERFRELEQIQFAGGGQGPSGQWAGYKPRKNGKESDWPRRKARMGLDPRILHAKLQLRYSLTRRGSRYAIFRTRGGELTMGTRHPQAGRHQKGTPGGQMVARPPIDLYDGDKREMVERMQDYLMRPTRVGR